MKNYFTVSGSCGHLTVSRENGKVLECAEGEYSNIVNFNIAEYLNHYVVMEVPDRVFVAAMIKFAEIIGNKPITPTKPVWNVIR